MNIIIRIAKLEILKGKAYQCIKDCTKRSLLVVKMLNSVLSILKSEFLFFDLSIWQNVINSQKKQKNESKICQKIALEMTVFDQKEFINNDHLLTFYFIPNSRLLSLLERPLHVIEKTVLQDKIPPPIKTFSTAYLQGVLQKKYIQLETFIFEKV